MKNKIKKTVTVSVMALVVLALFAVPSMSYGVPYTAASLPGQEIRQAIPTPTLPAPITTPARTPHLPVPIITPTPISTGTVIRSASSVSVNGIVTITLTPSPTTLFDSPGYQVTEDVPPGFQYIGTTTVSSTINGSFLTLTQMGSSPIIYTLRASATGTYLVLGVFYDENRARGLVEGTGIIVRAGYDVNGNGKIDRNEAVQAVLDYFSGVITKQEAINVVMEYFNQ